MSILRSKQGLIVFTKLSLATSLATSIVSWPALAQKQRTQVQTSDIAEILKSDVETDTLVVRTRNGKKFTLKVSKKQRSKIEKAVRARTPKTKPQVLTAQASAQSASGTLSVPSEKIAKAEKKSPWSAGYLGWFIGGPIPKVHDMTATWNLRHYFVLSYALDNGIKFSLRPRLDTNYNLEQGNTKNNLMDTALGVSKGGLKLPWNINLVLDGRVYVPTSKKSRNDGTNGNIYGKAILNKELNKVVALTYAAVPIYFWQSNRSLANLDDVGRLVGDAKGTFRAVYGHALTVEEKLTDKLTLAQTPLGFSHYFTYDDAGVGVTGGTKTDYEPNIAGTYKFTDSFSLALILGQIHSISEGKGIDFFDAERTSYQAQLSLTF